MPNFAGMPTVQIIIRGKVQGVFYRASAQEEALRLGITGWVRNSADGNVVICASGRREILNTFIEWARTGPRKAKVSTVEVKELPEEHFHTFVISR